MTGREVNAWAAAVAHLAALGRDVLPVVPAEIQAALAPDRAVTW